MARDWSTPKDERDIFWKLEMDTAYKNTLYAAEGEKHESNIDYLDGWYAALDEVCEYLRRSDISVPDDFEWPDRDTKDKQ